MGRCRRDGANAVSACEAPARGSAFLVRGVGQPGGDVATRANVGGTVGEFGAASPAAAR